MAQTAGGTYYAASSELVSSWPATSLDLANQLETRFAAKADTSSLALRFITSQTFTSAGQVNVDNVFTSSYTNYRVIIRITSANAAAQLQMRLRASGSNATGGNYNHNSFGYDTGGTLRTLLGTGSTVWAITWNSTVGSLMVFDIAGPQASTTTVMAGSAYATDSASDVAYTGYAINGLHSLTNAYDGFSFAATFSSNTNLTGALRVYGYRNS